MRASIVEESVSNALGGITMQKSFVNLALGIVLAAQILSAGSVYDYRLNSIDYETIPLRDFTGKC